MEAEDRKGGREDRQGQIEGRVSDDGHEVRESVRERVGGLEERHRLSFHTQEDSNDTTWCSPDQDQQSPHTKHTHHTITFNTTFTRHKQNYYNTRNKNRTTPYSCQRITIMIYPLKAL